MRRFYYTISNKDSNLRRQIDNGEDPEPLVYVLNVDPQRIEIEGYAWATNENWFPTRSDLWIQLLRELVSLSDVSLVLPKREIRMT